MSVRVTTTIQSGPGSDLYDDAVRFEPGDGYLTLRADDGKVVAVYAPGCWASATKLPDPPAVTAAAPEPAATFETTTTADGPFVSVSFTSNEPDSLVRLLRDAIRRDDDGTAGVLAKVPA